MAYSRRMIRTGLSSVALVALAAPVVAEAAQHSSSLDIAAQDMDSALKAIASATGAQVTFKGSSVRGKRSNAVRGSYSAEEAVAIAIRGSGLVVRRSQRGILVVTAAPAESDAAADEGAMKEQILVVTGTRIKGNAPASPVVVVTADQMREAGQRDLGEVIRSIPQNYTGGQNPGVRSQTYNIANQNIGGGAALNLRGLGPDATLTLLNGRRIAYSNDSQAVDVSVIPIDAVASLQVVPDGSSALYGSDAVGGVANIILRRDFDGLSTRATLGTSTGGGGFEQSYDAAAGTRWDSGGVLLAYQYTDRDGIRSDQRDWSDYLVDPSYLVDGERHHYAVLTGHQQIGDRVEFSIDGLFNHREVSSAQQSSAATALAYEQMAEGYNLSPQLSVQLGANWTVNANGFYGENKTDSTQFRTANATGITTPTTYFIRNKSRGAELNFEGPLLRLPGGDVRLALGGGYRDTSFRQFFDYNTLVYDGKSDTSYGFGELVVPVVSGDNAVSLIQELTLSAAYRYEHYSEFGGVGTPKLGLIYAPVSGVAFKASWGRSFKAPTMLQRFKEPQANLYPAASLGGVGYPADATVLNSFGGNADLQPERAKTWSASLEVKPAAIRGFKGAITYFEVDYRNRVVQPLLPPTAALSSPLLAPYITYNPSQAQIDALIAAAPRGLANYTNAAYDPAKIVAIAEGIYINAARQFVHGIDVSSDYSFGLGGGTANVALSASWLGSHQQNSPIAPQFQLAGTQFNPPHWRARGSLSWRNDNLVSSLFVNYVGPVLDTSGVVPVDGDPMTTVDATIIYRPPVERGPFRGLELAFSVSNLFDKDPPYLRPASDMVMNYDSTNYSAIGRFVSFSIRKAW